MDKSNYGMRVPNTRRCRRHHRGSTRTETMTSTHGTEAASTSPDEIPGYVYIPDTNRYYKVLPSFAGVTVPVPERHIPTEASKRPRYPRLLSSLSEACIGNLPSGQLKSLFWETAVDSLSLVHRQHLLYGHPMVNIDTHIRDDDDDGSMMLVAHPKVDAAAAVVTHGSDVHLVALHVEQKQCRSELDKYTLVIEPYSIECAGRVIDVCLAELGDQDFGVLSCATAGYNSSPYSSLIKLPNRFEQWSSDSLEVAIRLPKGLPNSCDWNRWIHSSVYGQERGATVCNLENVRWTRIFSASQPVLSAIFSQDGHLVYSGLRKGDVLCTDLRDNPGQEFKYSIKIGAPVSHLALLEDQTTLVVSGYQNQLFAIDLRFRKTPKVHYDGHSNSHRKIHCSIDEAANLLCSPGQDGMIRLWNLTNGAPLRTIRPPFSVNAGCVPYTCLLGSWQFRRQDPALLVAVKNSLLVYQMGGI